MGGHATFRIAETISHTHAPFLPLSYPGGLSLFPFLFIDRGRDLINLTDTLTPSLPASQSHQYDLRKTIQPSTRAGEDEWHTARRRRRTRSPQKSSQRDRSRSPRPGQGRSVLSERPVNATMGRGNARDQAVPREKIQTLENFFRAALLRDRKITSFDVVAIQEPWRNPFVHATHNPILPHFEVDYYDHRKTRVCFFLNRRIASHHWTVTHHTPDLSTLELKWGAHEETIITHTSTTPSRASNPLTAP